MIYCQLVNWTIFSLYEDFSRKFRSKCRQQNDVNFGRAALRHHIVLLCTTISRADPGFEVRCGANGFENLKTGWGWGWGWGVMGVGGRLYEYI